MPAVAEPKLSLQEFHERYDGEKPYYEYWDGEAVQKSMPTLRHGLIQKILMMLLDAIGYESASEVTLKLDPAYEPIPDVIASDGPIGDPYPTSAFDVIIDPKERIFWRFEHGAPQESNTIAQRGDAAISAQALWDEVDRQLARISGKL